MSARCRSEGLCHLCKGLVLRFSGQYSFMIRHPLRSAPTKVPAFAWRIPISRDVRHQPVGTDHNRWHPYFRKHRKTLSHRTIYCLIYRLFCLYFYIFVSNCSSYSAVNVSTCNDWNWRRRMTSSCFIFSQTLVPDLIWPTMSILSKHSFSHLSSHQDLHYLHPTCREFHQSWPDCSQRLLNCQQLHTRHVMSVSVSKWMITIERSRYAPLFIIQHGTRAGNRIVLNCSINFYR